MNTKIKTLFFVLFLVVSASVNAQDAPKKYEFATVSQTSLIEIVVSYAGKPVEKVKLSDTKNFGDYHEALAYVENLQNEGWSVFNTTQTVNPMVTTFYLRRLKK